MAIHAYNEADLVADLYARIPVDGELERLMGVSTIADFPASYWQYDANSSAADDWTGNPFTSTTIKPTAQGGNGRWIRRRGQEQANWNEGTSVMPSFIANKVSLASVATSGSYNDLSNKPTIPAAQVNSDWNSGSGLAQILNKPTIPTIPGATNVSAYGTGTAYTLTTSSAKITFGTTSPTVTITSAGTYLIISNITLDYTGLTTLAVAACSFKVRRTNNTAADIANTTQNFNVPVVTLLTQTGGDIDIPAFIYTTANNNDVLELWGSRGAITVGSIQVTNGYIVAVKIA